MCTLFNPEECILADEVGGNEAEKTETIKRFPMKKLLIFDSYKSLRLLYKTEFDADGYLVDTAAGAREALRLLERQRYDLIILDILHSGDESIEDLRKLLAGKSEPPVIINSSYDSNHDDFLSRNADSCVLKSSDLSELKQKVKESLGETVSVL